MWLEADWPFGGPLGAAAQSWGQDSHLCGQPSHAEPRFGPSRPDTMGQFVPFDRASIFSSVQWGHSRPPPPTGQLGGVGGTAGVLGPGTVPGTL